MFHPPLDLSSCAGIKSANGMQLRAVFVSKWEVKQQIFDSVDAHSSQSFCQGWSDSGQVS